MKLDFSKAFSSKGTKAPIAEDDWAGGWVKIVGGINGIPTAQQFNMFGFIMDAKANEAYRQALLSKEGIESHAKDMCAHETLFGKCVKLGAVVATRDRESWRPGYGLGGGGEDGGTGVVLEVEPYTGTAKISAVVSGKEYDAKNLDTDGVESPNGTIIIKKMEEENNG